MTTPADHTGTYTLQDAEEDIANLQGQIAVAGVHEAASMISPEIFGYATTTPRGPYFESFESGTGGFVGTNCALTQSAVTAAGWPTNGTNSLLLTANGAGIPFAIGPQQKCQPNDPVNLNIDVYTPVALTAVYIGVIFYDDNNVKLLETDSAFTATSSGQVKTLSVQAVSPSTQSAYYAIVIGDNHADSSGTLLYADNVNASGNLIFSLAVAAGVDSVGNSFQAGLDMSGVASFITGNDFLINSSGIFFYSGTPAAGNLIVSSTNASGHDSFGNTIPGAGVISYITSGGTTFAVQLAGNGIAISTASSPTGAYTQQWEVVAVKNGSSFPLCLAPAAGNNVVINGTSPGTSAALEVQGTIATPLIEAIVGGFAEGWHSLGTLPVTGVTTIVGRYRLMPDGDVEIDVLFSTAGAVATFGAAAFPTTLPAGYLPTQNKICAVSGSGAAWTISSSRLPNITVTSGGSVQLSMPAIPGAIGNFGCTFRYSTT